MAVFFSQTVRLHCARTSKMGLNQSNETLLTIDSDAHGYKYWSKFESEPFSEGASRYAYRGTLKGDGPRDGDKCVVKVFKKKYEKEILNWYVDITCSKVAQELAQQFNQFRPTNRPLSFKLPLVARIDKKAGFYLLWFIKLQNEDKRILDNEYVALEPYLEGAYDKFTSNSGWVNYEIGQLMPAFSHFTWWKSGQTMLVCDLQGESLSLLSQQKDIIKSK